MGLHDNCRPGEGTKKPKKKGSLRRVFNWIGSILVIAAFFAFYWLVWKSAK